MSAPADVTRDYALVPEDFVKHLVSTLVVVVAVVLLASLLFSLPEKPPLTIKEYATMHPVSFELMALRALDGTGDIANYGPPYNHGQGSVESPLQRQVGIIHPINAQSDFILKPVGMASEINPSVKGTLTRFETADARRRSGWESSYGPALSKGTYVHGSVLTSKGKFGPVPALLNDTLHLAQSGLMSGALIRNPAVITRFNNQNYLLFLQGAPLQTNPATQAMAGPNWGLIHPAINGYPGAWWMTIPTWIYQWPFVAAARASDALALSLGLLFWLTLALTPWIPGWNRLPRYLGIYRVIWRSFYRK